MLTTESDNSEWHKRFITHLLVSIQREFGDRVHVQAQQSGVFMREHSSERVRVNFTGIADIGGYLQGGRAFQIEVKFGPYAKLSPEQKSWRQRCERLKLPHFVAHANSAQEADSITRDILARLAQIITESGYEKGKPCFQYVPLERTTSKRP